MDKASPVVALLHRLHYIGTRINVELQSNSRSMLVSHHHLPLPDVVLMLETDLAHGLTSDEARARLERVGPNLLPKFRRHGPFIRFMLQFHHPLIYVLLGATAITAFLGEYLDAGVIFGVVLVNALVGFIQESRAELLWTHWSP